MPALDESFPELIKALADHYGVPETAVDREAPFPATAAALLAGTPELPRVTAAERALSDAGLLDPQALAGADPVEVRDVLKEGGVALTPRAVGPLLRLARWLAEDHHGDTGWLRDEGSVPTSALREELRGINGVGPATADALLLLALGRAVYPLDRATYRVLVRHGWLDASADYDEARDVIERQLPDDPVALARLSAWMERVGRDFCRATAPRCERCPLRPFLPDSGPVAPE